MGKEVAKYVIDIPDDIPLNPQFLVVYGTEPIGSKIRTYTIEMAETEELNSDYINEYFEQLLNEAYQRGYEEGKAVNDKGCEGCKYQANKELTCPCSECANNYKNQWKAKDDKIVVGDEVADKNGYKTIVTYIYGDLFDGLCSDGSTITNLSLDDNHKTDRHFDIDKILDEMKGNNDK